jgi:tetratricopeptide (TPR) repeat protein
LCFHGFLPGKVIVNSGVRLNNAWAIRKINFRKILPQFVTTVVIFMVVIGLAFVVVGTFAEKKEIALPLLSKLRDNLVLATQIFALLVVFCILLTVFTWLVRRPEGTSFLPFDIVTDKASDFDGKSISNALAAELARIYLLHKDADSKSSAEKPGKPGLYAPKQKDVKNSQSDAKPLSVTTTKKVGSSTRFDIRNDGSGGENLRPDLSDAVIIGIGHSTVSLWKLLSVLKQMRSHRDSLYVISGSFQKFSGQMRLIARVERRGDRTLICQARQEDAEQENVSLLIQDLAFKIYQEMPKIWSDIPYTSMKTWMGLKYYTEALDTFNEYRLTGVDINLEKVHKASLKTASVEKGNSKFYSFCTDLAWEYFSKKKYDYAEEILTCAKDIYSSRTSDKDFPPVIVADAANGLGASQAFLGKLDEAEGSYRESIRLDPRYLDAYVNLSLVLCQQNMPEAAKSKIQKAKDLGLLKDVKPDGIGDWYASIGCKDEALELYEQAIRSRPKDADLQYRLANLYWSFGLYESAVGAYEKAIAFDPSKAYIYNDLGLAQVELGLVDAAIDSYKAAIEKDAGFAAPHNNLALIYADRNEYEIAMMQYNRAIDLDSSVAIFYRNKGILYRILGNPDLAVKPYEKAIRLEPKIGAYHFELAQLYCSMDKSCEAIREFENAIALEPEDVQIFNALGIQFQSLGEEKEAIDQYKKSLSIEPNAFAYMGIGDVLCRAEKFTDAIKYYLEALKLEKDDPLTLISMAACYYKMGENDRYQAVKAEAETHKEKLDPGIYNQACYEALANNKDAALDLLEKALNNREQTPAFARRDIDFDFIRGEERFKMLVGE